MRTYINKIKHNAPDPFESYTLQDCEDHIADLQKSIDEYERKPEFSQHMVPVHKAGIEKLKNRITLLTKTERKMNQTKAIPLSEIVIEGNYRKTMDDQSIADLAASIKEHGLLQPIAVRTKMDSPNFYFLVVGERRLRAHQLLGLPTIEAFIWILNDQEAAEYRLIENMQREDVHPLEEAAGLAELLKSGKTVDEIAGRLGKQPRYVHQRLSLNNLNEHFRDLFKNELINLSGAMQLARITRLQQQELKDHLSGKTREWRNNTQYEIPQVHTATEISRLIKNTFFLSLHASNFSKKDETLIKKAGSCVNCVKRTGVNTMLFAELEKDDLCIDPKCFQKKCDAHYERNLEQLQNSGEEFRIILAEWQNNSPKEAVSRYDYDVIENRKESDKKVLKGIFWNGLQKGQVVDIRMKRDASVVKTELTEKEKKEREAAARKNKIKVQTQILAADKILEAITVFQGLEVYDKFLDYLVAKLISYPTKEMVAFMTERFGWTEPIDVNDYSNRREKTLVNVQSVPGNRKLEMLFAYYLQSMVKDSKNGYGSEPAEIAQFIGLDLDAIQAEATALVDAPKAKKGKQKEVAV